MKKYFFLLLASVGLMVMVPVPAEASICKCGNQPQFTSLSESNCCTQCATHGNTNLRGYPARYADSTDLDDLEVIACTNLNTCWCADTAANNGSCTAIAGQYVGSQSQCDALCSARNSVSRHFDNTGTYTAPSGADKCGNYCWCREGSGENIVCNNHVTSPLIVAGRNVAMVNATECSALCGSLGGSVGGFEPTYQAQRNPETCAPAAPAAAATTAAAGTGSSAARPSTPAPTVRLFNPLAGASTIVDIINRIINMIMGIVGAGALLMFVYGGIKWMTAGGDAKNVSDAQTILKNSTLGILLLMFSYTIITTFFSILR